MKKIVEIIPDELPAWAIEAMAEGQLFNTMLNKIKELEKELAIVVNKDLLKRIKDCKGGL